MAKVKHQACSLFLYALSERREIWLALSQSDGHSPLSLHWELRLVEEKALPPASPHGGHLASSSFGKGSYTIGFKHRELLNGRYSHSNRSPT